MANYRLDRFDVLVAPHLERLFRMAHRLLGNTADAQDLVQDTCVAACEHLAQLEASPHPVRWLLRVQRNRFIDGARRRRRAPVVAVDLSAREVHLPGAELGPELLLEQLESEHALERAFQRLDDDQQELLALRAEGYGLEEIQAITGIGKAVLRARLHRARRSLGQRMNEEALAPGREAIAGRAR